MTRRPARVSVAHPAGRDPVHFLVRRKAVHEHDRLALALVEEGDLHAVMGETRHAVTITIDHTIQPAMQESMVPWAADRVRLEQNFKIAGG